MVQGQVFLKREGEEGLALFLFNFFKVYHFYIHLEITVLFAKLCYAFEEKLLFLSPLCYEKKSFLVV